MKSEPFASAWISLWTISAPASPYRPCPLCSVLHKSFVLLPWQLPEKDQMLILANPGWPWQASWSSLPSLQPVQGTPRQETPGANSSQVGQIQPDLQRVSHDTLVPSGLLPPGVPTHTPCCPFQCPQIHESTLALPIAVGKAYHCCNPGSRHPPPPLSSQVVSLQRVVWAASRRCLVSADSSMSFLRLWSSVPQPATSPPKPLPSLLSWESPLSSFAQTSHLLL